MYDQNDVCCKISCISKDSPDSSDFYTSIDEHSTETESTEVTEDIDDEDICFSKTLFIVFSIIFITFSIVLVAKIFIDTKIYKI